MEESQSATQPHQSTPENTLNEKHVLAIQLKFEGMSYGKISEKIDVPIDTIKDWFRRFGLLHDEYKRFAQDQVLGLNNGLFLRLQVHTEKAMEIITEAMGEDSPLPIRLKTAQYVLDKILPNVLQRQSEQEEKTQDAEEVFKELGLTDEDFHSDKIEETERKIREHLRKKRDTVSTQF